MKICPGPTNVQYLYPRTLLLAFPAWTASRKPASKTLPLLFNASLSIYYFNIVFLGLFFQAMGSIFFLNRYCHQTLPLRLFFHPFCVFSNDTIYTYPRALDSNDAFAKLGVWSLHISSFSSPKGNTIDRNCGDKKDNCKISLWFRLGIHAPAFFFSKVLHCV